jgi:hypothetical protein
MFMHPSNALLGCVLSLLMVHAVNGQGELLPFNQNDNERVPKATSDLLTNLRDMRTLATQIKDRTLRREIQKLVDRAERNAAIIQADLLVSESRWKTLEPGEFQRLLAAIKDQKFSQKKSKYLKDYAQLTSPTTKRLSSQQVKKLLSEIDFDKDRVAAAVALYQITLDKENFLLALDALSFQNNRKAVRKQLGLEK